jgi:hypothetical protein
VPLGISSTYPVQSLALWAAERGGYEVTWLAAEDGSYVDDAGRVIDESLSRRLSPVDQLAAYGLWLATVDPDVGSEDKKRVEIIVRSEGRIVQSTQMSHAALRLREGRSARLALAAQAYGLACRLQVPLPSPLPDLKLFVERVGADEEHRRLSKLGTDARHAKMRQLRAWTIEQYELYAAQSPQHSTRKAAGQLQKQVRAKAAEMEVAISSDVHNFQQTIERWIGVYRKGEQEKQ